MTGQRIGFDRFLRRAWLDQAALLAGRLRDERALHAALLDRLAAEVSGVEARRKTVNVLTRAWWRVPAPHVPLRDEALAYVDQGLAPDRLLLHWGMLLLAFPLFRDVTSVVGRLLRLQGVVRPGQVAGRVAAEWGNTATLDDGVPRILRSLRDWDVLVGCDGPAVYQAGPRVAPTHRPAQLWLLNALVWARDAEMNVGELPATPELFPFALSVASGELVRSPHLHVASRGADLIAHPTHGLEGAQ